jgi:hypothetical protein
VNKKRKTEVTRIIGNLRQSLEDLEGVQGDEESALDNIPENLQGSQRYEDTEEALERIDDAVSSVQDAIENLENI